MRQTLTIAVLLTLLGASGAAQTPMQHHHDADSSPQYRDLPAPPLMPGLGDASLKITTDSAQAQAYFDQGLRLLHCFWDFEAYRAFKESARLDPDAAMAYWGEFEALRMAGNHGNRREEKGAALDKAKSLAKNASDHEQRYIRAAGYQAQDGDEAAASYRQAMEALIDRYPDDVDAQAFLALEQMNGYKPNGDPRGGELYSQAILRNLLAAHPNNAAANHYWIHAMEDSSHPEEALHSADILASLAPSSGHMVHMPGHIYWRLGDYERARQAFIASVRVEEAYMAGQQIRPEEDWNYAHNLAYLVAACAEAGRYQEGLRWAAKLRGMPAPTGMTSARFAVWAGGSVARLRIRFADWKAVAGEGVEFGMDRAAASPAARDFAAGLSLYAQGMEAVEQGNASGAETRSQALDAMLWRLQASKPQPEDGGHQEEKSGKPKEDDPTGILNLLGTLSLDLRANINSTQGNDAEAMKLFAQATESEKALGYSEPPQFYRPEQESLGYACLRAHQWEKARAAFAAALKERPQSGHALFGLAESYAGSGDKAQATQVYGEFLTAWRNADPELPKVTQAKAWLAAAGAK